jgi:hypothetical protein
VTQTPESAPRKDPPPADAPDALRVAKQAGPGQTPAFAAPGDNRPPDLEDLDEHLRAAGAPQAPGVLRQGSRPQQAATPQQPLAPPHEPPSLPSQDPSTPAQPATPRQQQPSLQAQAAAAQQPGAPQAQHGPASAQPQVVAQQQLAAPPLPASPAASQHVSAPLASASAGADVIASPMARAARQLLWRAKLGQKPVVALWLTPTEEGCELSSDVYPLKSLRVEPEHAGPYRFTSTEDAQAFAQEAARALTHLGCEVAVDERRAAETPAASSASLRSDTPTA